MKDPTNPEMIIFETIKIDDCDKKDPNAICELTVFGYSNSVENNSYNSESKSSSTQIITCGVTAVNVFGGAVGTLSQTTTVTWEEWSRSWANSYYNTSVINSTYWWNNMSGPSPASGQSNYLGQSVISTSGNLGYLLIPNWRWYRITTTLSGSGDSGRFSCGASWQ